MKIDTKPIPYCFLRVFFTYMENQALKNKFLSLQKKNETKNRGPSFRQDIYFYPWCKVLR